MLNARLGEALASPGCDVIVVSAVVDIFSSRFYFRGIFRTCFVAVVVVFIGWRCGLGYHPDIDENAMGDELRGGGGAPALALASTDPPRPQAAEYPPHGGRHAHVQNSKANVEQTA